MDKAHLPKPPETARPADLPRPVANVESPWAYALTATGTITVTAGAQSFPFYPYFNSEKEHSETLDACRVGAARLLKKLQAGRYHNVRLEYTERLTDYLEDLPQTAEGGSIFLPTVIFSICALIWRRTSISCRRPSAPI